MIHDVAENTDRGVGFMDVYVAVPEPATTLLILTALPLLLRKR